jgi:hypothetical protein
MIAFIIYLLFFLALIYYNGFFGLIKDDKISNKHFALLFLLKALAVPTFYIVYKKLYGGLELFDAGKFYRDASIISDFAKEDGIAYLRLLIGLQDDSSGSYDFVNYLSRTDNWDNGQLKDFLYNDNRVVIRLHSLFHFIAFKSYSVHALLNCFLSFVGLVFIYKSIKDFFVGKEWYVIIVLFFIPALWFYTGAVLKEGITIFVLGCQLYCLKKLITEKLKLKFIILSSIFLFISFFLKPYLLLSGTFCFGVFFYLQNKTQLNYKTLLFFGTLVLVAFSINLLSLLVKHSSLLKAVNTHQRVFNDAAKGGIFLLDSTKFVRVNYNLNSVKKLEGTDSVYTIKSKIPYTYWEHSHQHDTLFCVANSDTLTHYKLVYLIGESKSNIDATYYQKGLLPALGAGFYYSLFYPFFFNAKGPIHLLASLENLLILISFIIILLGIIQAKKPSFFPIVFLSFALAICLLAGLATPNSGAIFRYRSPVIGFIVLAAIYYLPMERDKIDKKN